MSGDNHNLDLPRESPCGFTMTDSDGEQTPCDEAGVSWRWYQGHEHEDMLERACTDHENDGGIRMAALVAEVRGLRAGRDRLRDAARGHVFDPENYISPLRPQIRALRDAILGESDDVVADPGRV